jgi:hypothetical protein
MKTTFKQLMPISTKRKNTSFKKKKKKNKPTTYVVGNPGPGLGQAQKCGGVNPVNGIPNLPS